MKTTNKLALLAALGMALGGASAYAQPDPAQPHPVGPPPGPPHARFGQMIQSVIHAYDANKDGQLDSTEMATLEQAIAEGKVEAPGAPLARERGLLRPPAHLSQEILDAYDADKDGILNETERAALRQAIQDGKLPPPEVGPGPRGPMRGPLTAQQILKRFDLDQDGKLDAAELNAFLDSRPGPGPMHRRGGGPPLGEPPTGDAPQN